MKERIDNLERRGNYILHGLIVSSFVGVFIGASILIASLEINIGLRLGILSFIWLIFSIVVNQMFKETMKKVRKEYEHQNEF